MAKFVGIREFARLDGCSPALIRKLVRQGRISLNEDRKLDASLAGTEWRQGNVLRAAGAPVRVGTRVGTHVRTEGGNHARGARKHGASPHDALSPEYPPLAESIQKKEHYTALLQELKFREGQGELIPMARAEAVMFDRGRSLRDAWLNWPVRVAPFIAAEVNRDAGLVLEVLTKHICDQIDVFGDPDLIAARGPA